MSLAFVTPGGFGSSNANQERRVVKLKAEGKLVHGFLFKVLNYATEAETYVPGCAIRHFLLSHDYLVTEHGPNEPNSLQQSDPLQNAQEIAQSLIDDAQRRADEIVAEAQAKAEKLKPKEK